MVSSSSSEKRWFPHIPLPLKLLLSYLLLIGLTTIPLSWIIKQKILPSLQQEAIQTFTTQVQSLAFKIGQLPHEQHRLFTEHIAHTFPQGLLFTTATGEIVFDSRVFTDSRHPLTLPDMQEAYQDNRTSSTGILVKNNPQTQQNTLFVTVKINDAQNHVVGFLRASEELSQLSHIHIYLKEMIQLLQIIAVVVALLLSGISAILFVRPLQHLLDTARTYAQGDLSAKSAVVFNDEVGDLARALEKMTLDIRRRLANAGSGDAVLAQLVQSIPIPCAVFETTGQLMSINGSARRYFHFEGPMAQHHMREVFSTSALQEAIKRAEADSDTEPVTLVTDGVAIEGEVVVLKRPGAPPLVALLAHNHAIQAQSHSSSPNEVVGLMLSDMIYYAQRKTSGLWNVKGLTLRIPHQPKIRLAEIRTSARDALYELLAACSQIPSIQDKEITLTVREENQRIGFAIDINLESKYFESLQKTLGLLGAVYEFHHKETILWLPRA